MIFNREFDKSLSLILLGDENNREVIVNFIKEIPYELNEKIMEVLSKFNEYESNNIDILNRDIEDHLVELFVSNNYKYWFNVDMIFGTLNIGRSFNGEVDIDITLYSNSKYSENDEQVLGYVNYGDLKLDSVCYEMRNTLFGKMVVTSGLGKFKRYRRIDTKMISDDVNVVDLSKMNGLVRSKLK